MTTELNKISKRTWYSLTEDDRRSDATGAALVDHYAEVYRLRTEARKNFFNVMEELWAFAQDNPNINLEGTTHQIKITDRLIELHDKRGLHQNIKGDGSQILSRRPKTRFHHYPYKMNIGF